jgi:hypothetical protein
MEGGGVVGHAAKVAAIVAQREASGQRSQQSQALTSAQHYSSEIATEFKPAIAQLENTQEADRAKRREKVALGRVSQANSATQKVDALTDYILAAQKQREADQQLAAADLTREQGAERSAAHFKRDIQGLPGLLIPPQLRLAKEAAFAKDSRLATTLRGQAKHAKDEAALLSEKILQARQHAREDAKMHSSSDGVTSTQLRVSRRRSRIVTSELPSPCMYSSEACSWWEFWCSSTKPNSKDTGC